MTYAIMLQDKNDILHFGIKRRSGRYPWGSGQRPYQSGGGPTKPPKNETPEQREARKQKVLKTARSATEIREFSDELSYIELDNALKRIDLNRKLDSYVKAEKEAGLKKVDDAMKKVGMINDWGGTAVQSLNNVNAIIDLLNSVKTAKEGEYKKYKEYSQQKNQGDSGKKKNK